jgi:hypothetical protein
MRVSNNIVTLLFIYAISFALFEISALTIIYNMKYIINRDPSFYLDRAYDLSMILREQGVSVWIDTVARSLASDHTHLPPAIPSVVFYLLSTDSLVVYATTIVAVYLAPIPVAAACLNIDPRRERGAAEILVSGLVALALMCPFVIRLMPTMPDFGGNLIITLAVVIGARMIIQFDDLAPMSFKRIAPRILVILSLFFTAVIFRRWYGFASIGLTAVYSLALISLAYTRKGAADAWLMIKILAATGLIFVALASPVLFSKLSYILNGGVFAGAYDAYRANYLNYFRVFGFYNLATFGLVIAAALCLALPPGRFFLFLTLLANALIFLMFFYIQAPGPHHFALLWPVVFVSGAVISSRLVRSGSDLLGAALLSLVSIGLMAWHFPIKPTVDRHYAANVAIAEKIASLELPDRALCPLGSVYLHNSLIENLWQVTSGHRDGFPKITAIPEADHGLSEVYAEGHISALFSQCQWIITGEKLPLLYEPEFHRILRYHHERLMAPDSIIGRAFELKDTLQLSFPVQVLLYARKPGSAIDATALEADYRQWLAEDNKLHPL